MGSHSRKIEKTETVPRWKLKGERRGEFADYIWSIMDAVHVKPFSSQKLQHIADPSGKHAY